ncbi:hypothetical protein RND71_021044 [Anisodus tanguticus]|uniref:Uncharacterized protein n=1 Tax=Anisodus tanguticus TaxID=243964 RepID=A0AAE1RW87_9SOLA|nr:hypothetical protein RND71_021044 [Anisodus tanguticus]
MKRKIQFEQERGRSGTAALHITSVKGHIKIVKELLAVNPKMCLARRSGKNPLHLRPSNVELKSSKNYYKSKQMKL